MQLPTLPSLPAGYIATEDDMNNLVGCCQFLYEKPMALVHDGAGGASIGGYAPIAFNTADFNNDGMWSSGANTRLTIQTPGWYKIRYGICMSCQTYISTSVYEITGSNNPSGSGIQVPLLATTDGGWLYGYGQSYSDGPAVASACGIWPAYLYQGDYLQVQAVSSGAGTTTSITTAASWFQAEYVSL